MRTDGGRAAGQAGQARRYVARPVTPGRVDHAEGPMWDGRTGTLVWVDQYAGVVHHDDWDARAGELRQRQSLPVGSAVGAVVPVAGAPGWLVTCADGYGVLAPDGALTMLAHPAAGAPVPVRMNDGKAAPDGSFWAGTIGWEKQPGVAELYRLAPDLSVSVVLRGVTISNGLAWTHDRALYYIDTPTQQVDRLELGGPATVAARRPVVRIPAGQGAPDGMCIDAEGRLWVALWGGGAVHCYRPTGELVAVVEVSAPQVSSCCFGGPDGSTLFVTTSQEGMDAATRERQSDSGRLFAVEVDAHAPPADAFVPAVPLPAAG